MSDLKSVLSGLQVPSATRSFKVPVQGQGVFFSDDFNSGNLIGWDEIGSNVSIVNGGGSDGSNHLLVEYSGKQTGPYIVRKNVSNLNLSEVYVKYDFKQDGTQSGSKFLKLFGKKDEPVGVANTTFAMEYSNNDLERVSFGHGDASNNDTQAWIKYDGTIHPNAAGAVVQVSTSKFNMPINEWHSYQAYMKYNTDNNRDGEYKVWIDEVLRLHVTNIKNRRNDNKREFWQIRLGDYTNGEGGGTFNLRYDNVVMSTNFIE